MLRMCDGVLDTDQDGSSISTKWGDNMGLRSSHFVLTEHTLVCMAMLNEAVHVSYACNFDFFLQVKTISVLIPSL